MTLRGALVFATLSASIAGAQTPRAKSSAPHTLREYTVDFGHSIVEFSIGFAFSRVKGRFTSAKGTILYDDANPANSSVTMVIDAKSIDTGWPHRDEHLRTDDFFDVDKYPTIVFQSDRLAQTTEGWVANGQLTMHGVTRSVAIPFHFPRLPSRSPESGWMVLNADAALRLKRTDFAILGGSTHNAWFDKARAATMADSGAPLAGGNTRRGPNSDSIGNLFYGRSGYMTVDSYHSYKTWMGREQEPGRCFETGRDAVVAAEVVERAARQHRERATGVVRRMRDRAERAVAARADEHAVLLARRRGGFARDAREAARIVDDAQFEAPPRRAEFALEHGACGVGLVAARARVHHDEERRVGGERLLSFGGCGCRGHRRRSFVIRARSARRA